ncbi:MAG TPA: hypothetical protein PKB11_04075 [Desulfovibrio sp.]|uniref:hypothetical protein n=1 Tax=Desulfovibrio sp. TaxID=885 RepID=UPI002BD1E1D4|nr:hypothetical protein [Desulfovibrio sp.]HMM37914.1 hypothetical protein [Desulfovibrio sp.]
MAERNVDHDGNQFNAQVLSLLAAGAKPTNREISVPDLVRRKLDPLRHFAEVAWDLDQTGPLSSVLGGLHANALHRATAIFKAVADEVSRKLGCSGVAFVEEVGKPIEIKALPGEPPADLCPTQDADHERVHPYDEATGGISQYESAAELMRDEYPHHAELLKFMCEAVMKSLDAPMMALLTQLEPEHGLVGAYFNADYDSAIGGEVHHFEVGRKQKHAA